MATREVAEHKINRGFAIHFAVYAIVVGALAYMNHTRNPDNLWVMWVAGGWGLGVVLHAILAFTPATREKGVHNVMERQNEREARGSNMTDKMSQPAR
ncbi:2TM domain-containing protein [Planctomyces sp. SH-PL14]|uniref:2TM domain-containing protein n=1 Tax=Planctomyces sp. SH-PL14 TaxID=1632864 RepID=UPI00078ECB2A|nr:2TM domain-containing protein [Planctomyces sp. SH-PL14]AMV19601.1 hypothetical protein VT03_17025 [Planctomyces sp. SH-PL14]